MIIEETTYKNGVPVKHSRNRVNSTGVEFVYHWMHIPSGKTGTRVETFMNRSDLLEALNDWNRSDNRWKYWTE